MSNNISVVIPFSQNFSSTTTLTADNTPGLTGHISPWQYVGSTTDVWLYGYDKVNNSNSWYINLLDGTIENEVGIDKSLKYLKRDNENINLSSFYCDNITVSIHYELSQYYSLENLYITTKQAENTSVKRYKYDECENNVYYYTVKTNLSIPVLENAFNFTFKYRENEDIETKTKSIRHDPRATEIVKLTLNGYNLTYNVFNISATGSIDYREYSRRLYLRDGSEHGYLRYDVIKERFTYKHNEQNLTMLEFNIIDSSLYYVTINGSDTNNDVLVPELKVKSGKFVCSIRDTEVVSGNEANIVLEYCELILYDSEASKVPYGSNILRITKS